MQQISFTGGLELQVFSVIAEGGQGNARRKRSHLNFSPLTPPPSLLLPRSLLSLYIHKNLKNIQLVLKVKRNSEEIFSEIVLDHGQFSCFIVLYLIDR